MLKKQRGGKRINAGRKPEGDAALKATIIARVTADQKKSVSGKRGRKVASTNPDDGKEPDKGVSYRHNRRSSVLKNFSAFL